MKHSGSLSVLHNAQAASAISHLTCAKQRLQAQSPFAGASSHYQGAAYELLMHVPQMKSKLISLP